MLNILLEQVNAVQKTRSSTTDNKPLRKHHEKLFTDVVCVWKITSAESPTSFENDKKMTYFIIPQLKKPCENN